MRQSIVRRPAREVLHRRELYALRLIGDGFLFRPLRLSDASAEIDEFRFPNIDPERANWAIAFARFGRFLAKQAQRTTCGGGENDFSRSWP